MSYKIKISKAGYNVLTETDSNNLVFSSDYNTLKYYTEGSIVLDGTTNDTDTVTHGLGYVPFFIIFVPSSFDATLFGMIPYQNGAIVSGTDGYAYADTDKLHFKTVCFGGGRVATLTFYYRIYKNSLGL